MADQQVKFSDGVNEVPVKAIEIGSGKYALAVGIPPGAGAVAVSAERGAPAVSVVTLTLADTEYSAAIAKSAGFEFRARTAAVVRFAFTTGKVAGPVEPYATLQAGEMFHLEADVAACTLYLASSAAGTVVEIVTYPVA